MRKITSRILAGILFWTGGLLTAAQASCPLVKMKVERLPDLNMPRAGHSVFYADGELTVVGGHTSGFVLTPTAEYLSGGKWHLTPTVYLHDNGMAVVLQGGRKVLIAGGHEKNLGIGQSFEVEMYNQTTHTFEGFGCLDKKRAFAQGIEMDSGRVLIAGNHKGNDALELFDGQKSFAHVKNLNTWRSVPYILRMDNDDVIIFGTVWRHGRFEPCDTVDRWKGESFTVPLLKEWMPMVYDQNSHAEAARIGDYSYLVAALNFAGEATFIRIDAASADLQSPTFTLLPTTCPVPAATKWGRIKYDRTAIVDRTARRAYLVGNDSTGRAYVLSAEYEKTPAPIVLYYTDPLPDFGDTTPVLTPDGDLIVTGGITDNNFAPFSTVWLLHLGTEATTTSMPSWLWGAGCLLVIALLLGGYRAYRTGPPKKTETTGESGNTRKTEESERSEKPGKPLCTQFPSEEAVMQRIIQLMESERLYQNCGLKVTDVAEVLGVHRNIVSACVNIQKGCTFNQFVNDYRVEHAKRLLLQHSDMKIITIGLESGFSNERSFFRAFKLATGLTPKEWAAQQDGLTNGRIG